jgi:L-asparaginase II
MGADTTTYTDPAHPIQREVKATLENFAGVMLGADVCAIDGCAVPTWAMPLTGLARAFAKVGTGAGLAPERSKALSRLRAAVAEKPWYVAGTGRFCTEVMRAFGARIFIKTGAEGVFCAALPEQGLGIAVKCDDGATRAAEVMAAAALARLLTSEADRASLERFVRPTIRNWNGQTVGRVNPVAPLVA